MNLYFVRNATAIHNSPILIKASSLIALSDINSVILIICTERIIDIAAADITVLLFCKRCELETPWSKCMVRVYL